MVIFGVNRFMEILQKWKIFDVGIIMWSAQ